MSVDVCEGSRRRFQTMGGINFKSVFFLAENLPIRLTVSGATVKKKPNLFTVAK